MENFKSRKGKNSGITLIALIITIIVLLILAGVTISAITGSENAMEKATEAREKNNVGALLDETNLALVNIEMENNLAELTVSEKIDKLKENGILNDDMTFVNNSDYSLSYSGDIIDNKNKAINNLTLTNDSLVYNIADKHTNLTNYDGECNVTVVNGKMEGNESSGYIFKANDAPDGYKFAYWVNQDNKVIQFNEMILINVCYNGDIIIPVYVKNSSTINTKNNVFCNTDRYWPNDSSGKQRVPWTITSYNNNTTEFKMIKSGVVRTFNEENIKDLYVNNSNVTTNLKDIATEYQTGTNYTLSFGANLGPVSCPKTMYLKGVTIFENKTTGEQEIVYSDLITLYPLDSQ